MNGKIVRETARGFGFIETKPHAEEDIFFHCSALANRTMETISEGEQVEFDVVDGPKGLRAENVRVI
jgi:cold shock protein